MDHATLPWQQALTPSQHYYGCLIALADIPAGCAPFTVAEGSLPQLRELALQLVRRRAARHCRRQHHRTHVCNVLRSSVRLLVADMGTIAARVRSQTSCACDRPCTSRRGVTTCVMSIFTMC